MSNRCGFANRPLDFFPFFLKGYQYIYILSAEPLCIVQAKGGARVECELVSLVVAEVRHSTSVLKIIIINK